MFGVFAAESDQGGLFSFRSLYEAYLACRKRKRNTVNALKFEVDLLENLRTLSETLTDGSYRPSRSVCFVTCAPKLREIFAADFRDRVVHHLLVPRLEVIFEPKFIHDSYACRLNKGTHAAWRRLQSFMNRVSNSGRRAAWFMQLDIRSFFMSIDRVRLLAMIERHITDGDLLALARVIIESDCTENYAYKGAPGLLAQIPPHKSLFQVPVGKGLPIGNLTSQFFANVYLNELDQFVKHTLKCHYYLRYVDDFILLHESKEALVAMEAEIEAFLDARLQLQVKQNSCLKRVGEGADFLGYIVRPDYILVRKRVLGNLHGKLATFKAKMVVEGAVGRRRYVQLHLRPETVTALRQTLASYLGHFVHADSRRLVDGLWEKHAWLKDIFVLQQDGLLRPEYEPRQQPKSLRRQYQWAWQRFGRGAPPPAQERSPANHPQPLLNQGGGLVFPLVPMRRTDAGGCGDLPPVAGGKPWVCIFFQVGRFIEFFGRQAHIASRVFGLALRKGRWPGVSQCGFPLRMLKRFKDKARHLGLSYVVIAEQGYSAAGLKRRLVTEKLTFVEG
ncbi:MAG: hypothetical protein K0A99_03075 [Desulfoarculaceae bacterium]|nr:hypothetical protein [Desulfoarculaceae bacterium]